MNKTINVHFRLKKRSSYVAGENLPIYLRLTIDGERTEFTTQREIDPAKKIEDIKLRELNYQFITDYEFFLKTVRNVEHNTAMGTIKKLKKIIRICVAHDWMEKRSIHEL